MPPNTEFMGGDVNPRVSPDGARIAFLRRRSSNALMTASTGGGGARELMRIDGELSTNDLFCWSADSRELIYSSFVEQAASNMLYRVPAGGGRPAPLPFAAPGLDLFGPSVARRGNRLVYVIPSQRYGIWRYSLPGRGRTAPAAERMIESNRPTRSPAWSPDGSRIAFDARPGGHSQIFVVDAEGGEPQALTAAGEESMMAEWSPDGGWIYYTSMGPDGGTSIRKVPSRGGESRAVTANGSSRVFPAPDGATLVDIGPGRLSAVSTAFGTPGQLHRPDGFHDLFRSNGSPAS